MTEQMPTPENSPVSPDQLSLLEDVQPENVTLEIPAETVQPASPAILETPDSVDSGTKRTIITALLIVGVAGYIAYWVQEPLQIKADVTNPPTEESLDIGEEEAVAENGDIAAGDETESVAAGADTEAFSGPSENVDISLFGFEPATLKIDKGTAVVWTNTSTEDQTVIGSSNNGQSFVSPVLIAGDSFMYQFDQDGTFEYYSTYNPALKASITVGLGDNSAAAVAGDDNESEDNLSPAADVLAAAINEAGTSTNQAGEVNDYQSTAVSAADETTPQQSDSLEQEKTQEELKPAADAPTKLAKTGPAENLYLALALIIGWLNRKKLYRAFAKQV